MKLKAKLLDIEAVKPIVVLNEEDAKELGCYSSDRIKISFNGKTATVIMNTTEKSVEEGELGIFEEVQKLLDLKDGDIVEIKITSRPKSIDYIKKRMDNQKLTDYEMKAIVSDIVDDNLSDIELSAFITTSYIYEFDVQETISYI